MALLGLGGKLWEVYVGYGVRVSGQPDFTPCPEDSRGFSVSVASLLINIEA